jgi:hypothetical protein
MWYFTALVDARGDAQRPARQQIYWRALATLPTVSMKLGQFKTRRVRMAQVSPPPNTVEVWKTEEKGSDVNLATALLSDGFKGLYEVAVVVSNDSDLAWPIQVVRDELKLKALMDANGAFSKPAGW